MPLLSYTVVMVKAAEDWHGHEHEMCTEPSGSPEARRAQRIEGLRKQML